MAWLIGIDEAGYGPNLGPFVMSAAAVRVPQPLCPWHLLRHTVRRRQEASDDRLVVDDSKAIYSATLGLPPLERCVWPFLPPANSLADLWQRLVLTPWPCYLAEPYASHLPLPVTSSPSERWMAERQQLGAALRAASVEIRLASVVIFPTEFNMLVRQAHSKAAVPLEAIRRLLGVARASSSPTAVRRSDWPFPTFDGTTVVQLTVDRLGGRKHYRDFLQDLLPEQMVLTVAEDHTCSHYRVGASAEVYFRVNAERQSFAVALASMVSKYLRELLMRQFNSYFRQHAPEIAPTAGYPVDAARWWQATAALRQRLGLSDERLWRCR